MMDYTLRKEEENYLVNFAFWKARKFNIKEYLFKLWRNMLLR